MSTDLERLARAKEREAKALDRELQGAAKRRNAQIKRKKLEDDIKTRRAFLIGETIRDAKLTHEEKAVVCGIMSRRALVPDDWDKVSDFTIHSVPAAPPHTVRAIIADGSARAAK